MRRASKAVILAAALVIVLGFALLGAMGGAEAPRQPVEFDHWQHVSKEEGPQLDCDACHEHAANGPHATTPNISTCMICHESMMTGSAEVQKLAAISARGEQPRWVRIYWFEREANVYFTHKPHVRAGVDCAVCHGEVKQAHRLRREVDQTMGWCIDCHRERQASVDCYACHR
ncbi:MAG TPA: cytochrome c3 family protein [Blastocatellia bacterium]|nr:cytochrome c3 family protein [Blastocatellia bacterium]